MKSIPYSTFTGKRLDLSNIKPDDIDINDIVHHLAQINRFNGALSKPVSVAQHCVYVSRVAYTLTHSKKVGLQGLFHDASEAYLGDITKWLKESVYFTNYLDFEAEVQETIYKRFNCDTKMHDAVEEADRLMVRFEAYLLKNGLDVPEEKVSLYGKITKRERDLIGAWVPWSWQSAREAYHSEYRLMTL